MDKQRIKITPLCITTESSLGAELERVYDQLEQRSKYVHLSVSNEQIVCTRINKIICFQPAIKPVRARQNS